MDGERRCCKGLQGRAANPYLPDSFAGRAASAGQRTVRCWFYGSHSWRADRASRRNSDPPCRWAPVTHLYAWPIRNNGKRPNDRQPRHRLQPPTDQNQFRSGARHLYPAPVKIFLLLSELRAAPKFNELRGMLLTTVASGTGYVPAHFFEHQAEVCGCSEDFGVG